MPRIAAADRLDPRFLSRWSPRAFSTQPVASDDLAVLFEAARWAPSCFNAQPWHFVWADADPGLGALRSVINDGNRVWADRAPVLALVFAVRRFAHNDKHNRWAAFDAGAAWMSLALQASSLGLATHAMGGFSVEQAHAVCGLSPDSHEAICAVAIGHAADPSVLPEHLQEREAPNDRKPVAAISTRL